MAGLEAREISRLPTVAIQGEITTRAHLFSQKGYFPNGLLQLVVDTVQYRPISLFMETGANQGLYRGNPRFETLWEKWIKTYDPFSGDNLAGTAHYQHGQNSPKDKRFPKPETPAYQTLVEQMGELGDYLRVLMERMDWEDMNDFFDQIS